MAVLSRKPHTLWTRQFREGYVDDDGHFHEGAECWKEYMKCDVVPASVSANIISYGDGRQETYDYTVYLPKSARDFEYGERVMLTRFGNDSTAYKVKGFQRYQTQCKLMIGHDGN